MKIQNKYTIDSDFLFTNYNEYQSMQNTLLIMPYSNFEVFCHTYLTVLNEDTEPEHKEFRDIFFNRYKDIVDTILGVENLEEQIFQGKNLCTELFTINKEKNVFMTLTKRKEVPELLFREDIIKDLSMLEYDVIATCLLTKTPIVSSNKNLQPLIKATNAPILYKILEPNNE